MKDSNFILDMSEKLKLTEDDYQILGVIANTMPTETVRRKFLPKLSADGRRVANVFLDDAVDYEAQAVAKTIWKAKKPKPKNVDYDEVLKSVKKYMKKRKFYTVKEIVEGSGQNKHNVRMLLAIRSELFIKKGIIPKQYALAGGGK